MSQAPTVKEHSISIKDKVQGEWATLTFKSRATNPLYGPIFLSSDTIEGTVSLQLKEPKKIKKLSVILRGSTTLGGVMEASVPVDGRDEADNGWSHFLEREEIRIPRSTESTSTPSSTPSSPPPKPKSGFSSIFQSFKSQSPVEIPSETLSGEVSFPFEMYIPPTVTIRKGKLTSIERTFNLPSTTPHLALAKFVKYDLILQVVVASNPIPQKYSTRTAISIQDHRTAPPSSKAVQTTLNDQNPYPSLAQNPDSWVLSQPTTFTGEREGKPFIVTCQLAFPTPLCYTRGDFVPIHLTIQGDTENLTPFSDLSGIQICLVRQISRNKKTPASQNRVTESDYLNSLSCIKCASLWYGTVDETEPGKQTFNIYGELYIDETLGPGFDFIKPSIAYHIVLLPFQLRMVKAVTKTPLAVQHIGIVETRSENAQPWRTFAPASATTPAVPKREGWYPVEKLDASMDNFM